ncbi:hypothetical protein C8R44DRAFT_235168 [Mycena epipterygia]|nr:hypothetical protein C8R44DRAFT_235168 [Mycena epipterygia]
MPTLPSSQLPAPSSLITLVGFIVFVLVVACGSGLYLFGLHLHDKLVKRRARASDIEKAAGAVSVSGSPVTTASVSRAKKTAAATALVAARAHLTSIVNFNTGPANLIVSSAVSGRKVVPRTNLRHLGPDAVPARFVEHQKRARPGPSPLRAIVYVAEVTPVAVPELIIAAPIVVQFAVMESPLSTTLDDLVLQVYHTADDSDSESEYSDSDSDFDDQPTQFDGLRMVRSTVDSCISVRAGPRKVKTEPVILAPPVLSVSHTANTTLRRAIHVKRPSGTKPKRSSVSTRRDKENGGPIQSPRPALLGY